MQVLLAIGAVMSPLAVLVGVWLGSRLQRDQEDARWLREQRLREYIRLGDLIIEVEDALIDATGYVRGQGQTVDWSDLDEHRREEIRRALIRHREDLEREESRIQLLAGAKVRLAVLAVAATLSQIQPGRDDDMDEWEAFSEALHNLRLAMKAELGVPPL